ncbi:MAG: MurR/RpiR family transcriptional regulator [Eubacteriales bacterium]|nr:MurR/RpiR family transcriptional regulator [Eubacteriales bacterium]
MKSKTVMENIYDHYEKFFSAEKKVADYVIKDPMDTVECTVAELAEKSGASDATVVRMCKHLGYKGYYQFRIMLARELEWINRNNDVTDKQYEYSTEKLFRQYADTMLGLAKNISVSEMEKSAELLHNCKWVHIIAAGNTSSLASYMGFRLERLGIRATFHAAPEYYMNQINLAEEDDVIVAITRSGSTKIVVDGIKLAKEKGLKVITITEYNYSEAAKCSDHVLLSNANANKFEYFRSHAQLCETAVIDALMTLVSKKFEREEKRAEDYLEIRMSDLKI